MHQCHRGALKLKPLKNKKLYGKSAYVWKLYTLRSNIVSHVLRILSIIV